MSGFLPKPLKSLEIAPESHLNESRLHDADFNGRDQMYYHNISSGARISFSVTQETHI